MSRRAAGPSPAWPALAGLGLGVALAVAAGGAAVAVASLAGVRREDLVAEPLAFVAVAVLPLQAALLAATLAAARLEREPLGPRLGLRLPPALPAALLVLATPVPAAAGGLLAQLVFDAPASEWMQRVQELVGGASGAEAAVLAVAVTAVPALCEELFFRGLVQRGLARAWPAPLAVGVAAVAFAAVHLDPVHVVGVLPIGLWLGFAAWALRSTWAAALAHLANNALAFAVLRAGEEAAAGTLAVALVAFVVAVPVALRARRRGAPR